MTETYARDVGKWLLIARLIGIVTGLVIVPEVVVFFVGFGPSCYPPWLMIPVDASRSFGRIRRDGSYHALCDCFVLAGFDALAPDLYNGVVVPYHDSEAAAKRWIL